MTTGPTAPDGAGTIEAGEHRLPVRVYYEDTDAAGLVYYANYLRFAERARTEMIRCFDVEHAALRADRGLMFAVRRCCVDYLAAGQLDDRLEVRTRVVRVGGASLDLEQRVFRGDRLLVRMDVRLALLSADLRPVRLPPPLRQTLRVLHHEAARGEPAAPDRA